MAAARRTRRRSPKRCCTASDPRVEQHGRCGARSVPRLRHDRRRSPSGSAGVSSASSASRLTPKPRRARLAAVTPLKAALVEIVQAASARSRASPSASLVEIGLISPGTVLYDARGAGTRPRSAPTARSPAAGARRLDPQDRRPCARRAACNGWTFWHYEADGTLKPIDALREAARRELELAGLRPGRARSRRARARELCASRSAAPLRASSRDMTQRQRAGCSCLARAAHRAEPRRDRPKAPNGNG